MRTALFKSIIYCAIFFSIPLLPVTKGSESAVSVESAFTFPAGEENVLLGFGWFKNGFTLQDATTTCTFNCVNPVSGNIDFRGGTLYLSQDFYLKTPVSLLNIGTILGNQHVVDLCSTVSCLADNTTFENVIITLNNDLIITGTLTFRGNCTIFGRDRIIRLDGGALRVDSNAQLKLVKIQLEGISGTNVACVDDTGQLILNRINWCQAGDAAFDYGSISFVESVNFSGTYSFLYDSSQTSTIINNAQWRIGDGLCLKIGRKLAENYVEPLACADETAQLKLNNCTFCITPSGFCFTKGQLVFDKEVNFDVESTTTSNGFVMGNGRQEDDGLVIFNSASRVNLRSGHITYDNVQAAKLVATGATAEIVRYPGSHLYMNQSIVFPEMILQQSLYTVEPIGIAPGKEIRFDGTHMNMQCTTFKFTGNQTVAQGINLPGSGMVILENGYFPLSIAMSGSLNHLVGTGDICGAITLQDDATSMIWDVNGLLCHSVVMNNGSIELGCDMQCSNDILLTGSGYIDVGKHCIILGASDLVWTSTIEWTGDYGALELNSKVSLTAPWTFKGTTIINGYGNILDLGQTGSIIVDSGAKLILKNVRVTRINGTNVRCVDDTASLILDDMAWTQTGNYTFDAGSILFKNQVNFSGTHTFVYDSYQTSTIDAKSQWLCSENMWLTIGRKTADATVEPLAFVDQTSILKFDTSALNISQHGFKITKGHLICGRDGIIEVNSTSTAHGFALGDGTSAGDVLVEFYPGAAMRFTRGHVIYDVTMVNGMVSQSPAARMIRYNDSTFYLKQDLCLAELGVQIEPLSQLLVADGKNLYYDNGLITLDQGEFYLKGIRYSSLATMLYGDCFIYMNKGVMPVGTIVAGTGNKIHGNGSITGPIILQNSSAELLWGLNGSLNNNIALNGGILHLEADVMCIDSAIVAGPGNIELENYRLKMGAANTIWSGDIAWSGTSGVIDLNANVSLAGKWSFSGNVMITGRGNTIDLGDTGSIEVNPGCTLYIKDVSLRGVNEANIHCIDDTASIVLDSVNWLQTGDYTFDYGSILFKNAVNFSGSYTFAYTSAQTSTISEKSELFCKENMFFSIGRKTEESPNEPLAFIDQTSILKFDTSTLSIAPTGMRFTKGDLVCGRDAVIDINSTSTGNGFALGDGTTAGDVLVEFYPGCAMRFTKGHVVYDVTMVNGMRSQSPTARMIRYKDSIFYLKQNLELADLGVQIDPLSQLIVANGKALSYDNGLIILDDGQFYLKGVRYSALATLLPGNGFINMAGGLLPIGTVVAGTGNKIFGNGRIMGPIIMQPGSELIWGLNGILGATITLNGGTLRLDSDLVCVDAIRLLSSGSVDLDCYRIQLGSGNTSWAGTIAWEGTSGVIDMDANVELTGMWTFSGDIVIQGNGNTIDLADVGVLCVRPGSTLRIKNSTITGITGTNIRCCNNEGTILLDSVAWMQDGLFTFTQGAMEYKNNVTMYGSGAVFAYQTSLPSLIRSQAVLTLDDSFTYSYDPCIIASKNLFTFENESSQFVLKGATFHATGTGVNFTKGAVRIERGCRFASEKIMDSDGNWIDEGITFGDGVSDANDVYIKLEDGATLQVTQGSLNYNNLSSASFGVDSFRCGIDIGEGVVLRLYQSLPSEPANTHFKLNTVLARAFGKDLLGSMTSDGEVGYVDL